MILFTGGVCLSACWDTTPPGKADPPWQGRPPWQGDPPERQNPLARQKPLARQTPWQGDIPGRADPTDKADPPGKADPPCAVHTGRYSQQAGSMHPTGIQFLLTDKFYLEIFNWCIFAGLLESVNSSILAACRLFKEVVGKKSGFYVNQVVQFH